MTPDELASYQRSLLEDPLALDVWRGKYRHGEEDAPTVSRRRVVDGVYANDPSASARIEAHALVQRGVLVPAGRVNAGAGTGRRTTLLNCFVNETVQDSMPGINRAIARAALTLQQGGGIGTDWSTVRPAGALVKRTSSVASGVVPFMRQMNAMAATAASAGDRRGAMMGTLSDDHPDLWNPEQHAEGLDVRGQRILTSPSFLSVKTVPGELTFMNLSVLVSDAFRRAIDEGMSWDLGHHSPRADGDHVDVYDRPWSYGSWDVDEDLQVGMPYHKRGDLAPWYVYRRLPARQLWDEILRTTYKYAEPGVIFVDRVNQLNNLAYCEDIRCTNPCGEQPLPPNNVCCLASVNLAFLVKNPFTPRASIDEDLYWRAIHTGVRFLDNVLDETNYPLAAQREASMAVRRIGLGVTGFGDMLVQLGVRYGSEQSVRWAWRLAQTLKFESYLASTILARERGPFPALDRHQFLRSPNVSALPHVVLNDICEHGIRNGVLNTIAPNGTISLYVGNVSSGHEPVFSFRPSTRKIRQPDDTVREYEVVPYSLRLYRHLTTTKTYDSGLALPDYFVGAMDLTPDEHLVVHGAWQEHVDAAVSKTINCPASMTFEDFRSVYDRAYTLGAKGCTTYRPDPESGRGSVLSETEADAEPPYVPTEAQKAAIVEQFEENVRLYGQPPPTPKPEASAWIELSVGRCPGCRAYSWMEAGREQTCLRCHEHPLDELSEGEKHRSWALPPPGAEAGKLVGNEDVPLDHPASGVSQPTAQPDASRPDPPLTPRLPDDDSDSPSPLPARPTILEGRTHKLKWPVDGVNWYVTVTNDGVRVREIFVAGGDAETREWVEALARCATAVLRREGDARFLVEELQRVASAKGGAFVDKVHRPSVVAAIGGVLEHEMGLLRLRTTKPTLKELEKILRDDDDRKVYITPEGGVRFESSPTFGMGGGFVVVPGHDIPPGTYAADHCPKCGQQSFIHEAGCKRCLSCGYEACG